ncbi:hypothetical protein BLOT_015277 [Blomia tropicalis]|nr:hypothetical protein BLOT_015277 [Blomia tropicalis]
METSPSLFTNPVEGIIIGVLAICGLSLFGIPLLMMLANMFSLNGNTGIGIIPTATTSVNAGRRRKRSAGVNLLNDHLLQRAMETFNSFLKSEDKMQMLQRLIS